MSPTRRCAGSQPAGSRLVSASRGLALLFALLLTACGRYADFTLPAPAGPVTASNFRWTAEPSPVLLRGDWDSRDVLNPSVIQKDGVFYNLYSGFDGGAWHTGLATSADGLRWSKQGRVLSAGAGEYIAANGSALFEGQEFLYWYHSGPRGRPLIRLARSADAKAWRVHPGPVLEPGPRGSFDESGVADPYVIRAGGRFYLYYLGQDRARRQRLGVARSADGVAWEKLRANPVLELDADEAGLGEPAVWQSHGRYWMLYTFRDQDENRRLRLARSGDGVHWGKLSGAISGDQAWNAKVLCDPTVVVDNQRILVWFGGGDAASPDENLNGQIGAARLAALP